MIDAGTLKDVRIGDCDVEYAVLIEIPYRDIFWKRARNLNGWLKEIKKLGLNRQCCAYQRDSKDEQTHTCMGYGESRHTIQTPSSDGHVHLSLSSAPQMLGA